MKTKEEEEEVKNDSKVDDLLKISNGGVQKATQKNKAKSEKLKQKKKNENDEEDAEDDENDQEEENLNLNVGSEEQNNGNSNGNGNEYNESEQQNSNPNSTPKTPAITSNTLNSFSLQKSNSSTNSNSNMLTIKTPTQTIQIPGPPMDDQASRPKLFVGQLPKSVNELELRKIFEPFGTIVDFSLIRDKVTMSHRGCGFLTYSTVEEAQSAIDNLHEKQTFEPAKYPLQLKWAISETEQLSHKLYVSMLPKSADETFIKNLFGPFGDIESITILKDRASQESTGCAFVKYKNSPDAHAAVQSLNQMRIGDKELNVKFAESKREKEERKVTSGRFGGYGGYGGHGGGYGGHHGGQGGYGGHGGHGGHGGGMGNNYYQGSPYQPSMGGNQPYGGYNQGYGGNQGYGQGGNTGYGGQGNYGGANQGYGQNATGYGNANPYGTPPGFGNTNTYQQGGYGGNQMGMGGAAFGGGGVATGGSHPPPGYQGGPGNNGPNFGYPDTFFVDGPLNSNLFFYHLPQHIGYVELAEMCAPYGKVLSTKVFYEKDTGQSKGYGFASFDNPESAQQCVNHLNGYQIGYKRLKVSIKVKGQKYGGF